MSRIVHKIASAAALALAAALAPIAAATPAHAAPQPTCQEFLTFYEFDTEINEAACKAAADGEPRKCMYLLVAYEVPPPAAQRACWLGLHEEGEGEGGGGQAG